MRHPAVTIQETCDAYFARYYRQLVTVLVVGSAAFTAARGYALVRDWEQWTVGEWLISYGNGFVRRGLTGEMLLTASIHTGVPANILVFLTFSTLLAVFCVLYVQLLRRKHITFWYVFLCLSPACLLFTVYNPEAIGRQELVLYVLFILWAHASMRGYVTNAMLVAFAILGFFATLVHELFFLFTPYFVLLSFVQAKVGRVGLDWKRALVIPAGAAMAALSLLLLARSLDARALCDRIVGTGAPDTVCNGILAYGEPNALHVAADFVGHLDQHVVFSLLLVFPIVLLPVYLFLAANGSEAGSPSVLVGTFALFIVFSAPLFVLAVDWGRWISIHTVLATVMCAHFLRDEPPSPSVVRRPAWRFSVADAPLVAGLLILSSTLLWSVNYCCSDQFLNLFGPLHVIGHALRPLA